MTKKIFIASIFLFPAFAFAQTSPINDTQPTVDVASLVSHEIVSIPLFILQNYAAPLTGLAIIIVLASALFGFLKLIGFL